MKTEVQTVYETPAQAVRKEPHVPVLAQLELGVETGPSIAQRLGSLAEVQVNRGEQLPDGGMRLVAANPVFVAWGPEA